MPLIVDTFNVLHQTGVLPTNLAGIGISGLIQLLARSRFRRQRVRLVCDGVSKLDPTESGENGNVTIEFSGKGRTADEVIAARIQRSTSPRQLTIISSDREVQRAARRRRCNVIGSPEFLRMLATDFESFERAQAKDTAARPTTMLKPLKPRETSKWLREFGLADDAEGLKLSEHEQQEIDKAADALLKQRKVRTEKLVKPEDHVADAQQETTRTERRARRAREREALNEQGQSERLRDDGLPLPMELLAEAERLWQRERGRHGAPD